MMRQAASLGGLAHGLLFCGMLVLSLNYLAYSALGFDALRVPMRAAGMVLLALSATLNFRQLRFDLLFLPMFAISVICVLLHGSDALNMVAVLLFVLTASPHGLKSTVRDLTGCFAICTLVYLAALAGGRASTLTYVMEGRTRNTLGFSNVNAAALFFLPLLLLLARKHRHPVVMALFVALAFVGIFALTNTRSALITAGAFFAAQGLFVVLGKSRAPTAARTAVGLAVLLALVVFTFALPLLAGSDLDYALSYRPTLFHNALKDFSLQDWLIGSATFSEVDNSFIVIVGHYGLVFFGCALAVLVKAIRRICVSGDSWAFSFIVAIVACGSVESFLYRPELIAALAFWLAVFGYAQPHLPADEGGR